MRISIQSFYWPEQLFDTGLFTLDLPLCRPLSLLLASVCPIFQLFSKACCAPLQHPPAWLEALRMSFQPRNFEIFLTGNFSEQTCCKRAMARWLIWPFNFSFWFLALFNCLSAFAGSRRVKSKAEFFFPNACLSCSIQLYFSSKYFRSFKSCAFSCRALIINLWKWLEAQKLPFNVSLRLCNAGFDFFDFFLERFLGIFLFRHFGISRSNDFSLLVD